MNSVLELGTTRSVDVLLINPGNTKQVYQGLSREFSAIEPPSLAALFATYLRKKGASVDIIDAPALQLSAKQVAEIVEERYSTSLVVLVVYGFQPSASTQNMPAASETAKELKSRVPHLPLMMTGTHPAALPERTLKEEAVDYVCDGEGPDTIWGLLEVLRLGVAKLSSVPNLWFRENSEIRHTGRGPLIENLDEVMPNGAWDLLPMANYRSHNWHAFDNLDERSPYVSIHTSLGCPYKCSFCCINAPFGKPSYRMWSAETVAKEIEFLVRTYGVRNIKFVDEMFVLNREHVLGICDKLIDANLDLNIWAYARVDTVRDEFLTKLRQAGFRWLALGIESGSKHVRDGVEKGRFGTPEILKTVRKVQDAGINVIGNYIFGLPDDTMESMEDTYQLAVDANCEFANFYSAMAYPGSKLYETALLKNLELPRDWIGFSQHSYETLPLRTEKLSSAEVLRFRDEAFRRYFSNSTYLNRIREKFGERVVAHLREMIRVPLNRKLYSVSSSSVTAEKSITA